MKIALYSHSIAPSIDGVSRRFTGIIWELCRQGYDVLLFTLEDKPQDLPSQVKCVTIDHMTFPSYPGKKVARPSILTIARIINNLRDFNPAIVHVTADGNSQIFALAGILLNIPVLGSFHTDLIDLLIAHNANFFQKFCVNFKERTDSVIFDSSATTSTSFAEKLKMQGISTEHVIITAVDTDTFKKERFNQKVRDEMTFNDKKGLLCVLVGRISAEKRIDVMVDAIKSIDGVYLAIVGDGPTASIYSKLHGKANRIYCKPGFLSHKEVAEVYASSDLHVSASQFETLGNTVLEAFACSKPVVAPRAQGFLDTITHEYNGFLFSPGDSESANRYITLLKNNLSLREEMGIRGRNSVENRSIKVVVEDIVSWYSLGISKCKSSWTLKKLLLFLVCFITVPFALVVLNVYDLVLSVLVRLGLFSTKPPRSHKAEKRE